MELNTGIYEQIINRLFQHKLEIEDLSVWSAKLIFFFVIISFSSFFLH
jgi:hypothetical protein